MRRVCLRYSFVSLSLGLALGCAESAAINADALDGGAGAGNDGGTAGSDETGGVGGTGGTGTTAGVGGTGGTGTTAGVGGTGGSAGTAGTGGTAGTAGAAGTGATAGTGGSGGTAGTAGAGGTAGSAGTGGIVLEECCELNDCPFAGLQDCINGFCVGPFDFANWRCTPEDCDRYCQCPEQGAASGTCDFLVVPSCNCDI